jgi:hypothetical protein
VALGRDPTRGAKSAGTSCMGGGAAKQASRAWFSGAPAATLKRNIRMGLSSELAPQIVKRDSVGIVPKRRSGPKAALSLRFVKPRPRRRASCRRGSRCGDRYRSKAGG